MPSYKAQGAGPMFLGRCSLLPLREPLDALVGILCLSISCWVIRCCSGFSDFVHFAKLTKEAGLEITPLVRMDGIRGTIPINPVVHQGSRAGFCSLVWCGIGLDPLCKQTLGSQDVTVTTFGSGKWANDINEKSLERVRRRNRAEQGLGRFPGGLALGTG